MMHVDSLQRYRHRNKEQTLQLIAFSLTVPESTLVMFQTCLSHSQDLSHDAVLCFSGQLRSGGPMVL